jgi:hypothetical protein
MSAPAPTTNPLTSSATWRYFLLNGVPSPGTIVRPNGMKGFVRETGWDEKAGKGTQGATLTLKTMPPAKGSFTLQLFQALYNANASYPGVDDFGDWDAFVEQVLAIGPKEQQASGLNISYPGLASVGVYKVVVKSYTPPVYMGKGLYHVTIELIEWQQPPPVSVVKTVAKTAPDQSAGPGQQINPQVQNLQLQIAQERLKGGQ